MSLILISHQLHAQFPTSTQQQGTNMGARNFNQGGAGFPGGATPFGRDSANFDSSAGNVPQIKPSIHWIDRNELFRHSEDYKRREKKAFELSYYWDKLDPGAEEGFIQNLGQVGKPYQLMYHGLNESVFDRPYWRHPITGKYNRYMLDPENQVKYFDTRTPYVNADYTQGPQDFQLIDVTISQNITPFWNAAIYFDRVQSVGAYRNNVTDLTSTYFSSNYRTKNNRYRAYGNITYNKYANEMNGGVPRRQDDSYPVVDGILREVATFYNASFFKGLSAPNLASAQGETKVTTFYGDQYLQLIGLDDSVKKANKLTFRNSVTFERLKNRFVNSSISSSSLANNLIPVYPSIPVDSTYVIEGFNSSRFKILGEASYSFQTPKGYGINVNGGISYQLLSLNKDILLARENVTEQYANGEINTPILVARGKIRQRLSTIYNPSTIIGLSGTLYPLPKREIFKQKGKELSEEDKEDYFQSRSRSRANKQKREPEKVSPLSIEAEYDLRNMNPYLFQTHFVGDSGNAYRPSTNLANQTIMHGAAGLRYDFPRIIRRKDTLLPMYISLKGFFTQASRFMYYDTKLRPLQADDGDNLNWVGVEAAGRLRLLRKFYVETHTSVQQGSSNSINPFLQWQAQNVPLIFGKTSVFYDNSRVTFAERVRIGVDVYYNTAFIGQSIDVLSNEFFQTNYQVPGYGRIDAFAAMQIKGVYIYGKFTHANEGLLLGGYYTTPFYPMLERSFMLGVYWSFFN
ncbi:MAG: putative porin [Bacteroidia bacterium]